MKVWLQNLSVSNKFRVLFVLSLVMVAWPMAHLVKAQFAQLRSAQAEAAGIAPADRLLQVLRLSQQHRGLSALVLAGNREAVPRREAKQQEVDTAWAAARASIAGFGQSSVSERASQAHETWKVLAADVAASRLQGPVSFGRHTAMIAQQLELLEEVVDASTMALDPEGGTYYMIQAALVHAPRLTETLGQLRARGGALLTAGRAEGEDRARVAALVESARGHGQRLHHALAWAERSDPSMAPRVQQVVSASAGALGEGLALATDRIVLAPTFDLGGTAYFDALTRTIDVQFSLMDTSFGWLAESLDTRVREARATTIGTGLGVLAAALLTAGVMSVLARQIRDNTQRALALASAVAQGDLRSTITVDSKDELGRLSKALLTMNHGLVDLVSQVRESAETIATGSSQIAAGNDNLSSRTEQQAGSLQQTAASMDQLTSTVRHNAEVAAEASKLAGDMHRAAENGGERMAHVVRTMHSIEAGSRRIADIIATIDGIAFQTNILALNAAVEAARAGEQGRGFAVVAGEVRSLAQRSADAAREIKQLIGQSVEQVEAGSRQVDDAGVAVRDIVQQVSRVARLLDQISGASHDQHRGIDEVGRAVQDLDRMTQENAALVEEGAAATESLNRQAARLAQAVGRFQL